MKDFVADSSFQDVVTSIELLNEPAGYIGSDTFMDVLKQYYCEFAPASFISALAQKLSRVSWFPQMMAMVSGRSHMQPLATIHPDAKSQRRQQARSAGLGAMLLSRARSSRK